MDFNMLKYQSVHVQENIKVTEIRDAVNHLRYKVTLESFHISDDAYGTLYKIQVINYFSAPEPIVIYTRPNTSDVDPSKREPPITDYNKALEIYNLCVKNYTNIVKAETRDFQDIDVYKDKIDYHMTTAKCCGTCKWCRETPPYLDDYIYGETKKLECCNPLNITEFDFNLIEINDHKRQHTRHMPPPHYHKPKKECAEIYPNVEILGLCKNYESRISPLKPLPGDSMTQFIDKRCNIMYNQLKSETSNVSTDIVDAITESIVNEDSAITYVVTENVSNILSATIVDDVRTAIREDIAENPPIINGSYDVEEHNNEYDVEEVSEIFLGGGAS